MLTHRTFALFLLLAVAVVPLRASAGAEGKMTPTVWYLDTEVMINGTELLGPIPSERKLCFAPEANKDDLRCFPAGHQNISKWAPTSISFVPPKNAPPRGVVILLHPRSESECYIYHGEQKCQSTIVKDHVEIGSYRAHPHIARIVDTETGEVPSALSPSRTYEIQGYRFGDTGTGLYEGVHMMSRVTIVRWAYDSILFSPQETMGKGTELFVHNGAGKGKAWIVGIDGFQDVQDTGSGAVRTASGIVFSDVSAESPISEALTWGVRSGIIAGYEDGSFRPENAFSRAEWLKVLLTAVGADVVSSSGSSMFTDVDPEAWYVPYVQEGLQRRLANGYDDRTFRPAASVTLAEGLAMAYRALRVPTADPQGNAWYDRYIEHALANDMLLAPQRDPLTALKRGEGTILLWKLHLFQESCACSFGSE